MTDTALYEPHADLIAANRAHSRALARLASIDGRDVPLWTRVDVSIEVARTADAVRVARAVLDHDCND